METWRLADLHAYVDDCLEPEERRAFEKRMAQDPALARHAAAYFLSISCSTGIFT